MKKSRLSSGILVALVLSSPAALASMSPELKVTGTMAVPTCTVGVNNNGVADLGKISNGLISSTQATALAEQRLLAQVECEAETYLSFTIVDNRAGTASLTSNTAFGLGNVNGTGKLGYYTMVMNTNWVDGTSVMTYSTPKGSTLFTASSVPTSVDKTKVMGYARANNVQVSGKKFVTDLKITPFLASSKDMGGPLSDSVKLDGSATLNFAYGL